MTKKRIYLSLLNSKLILVSGGILLFILICIGTVYLYAINTVHTSIISSCSFPVISVQDQNYTVMHMNILAVNIL